MNTFLTPLLISIAGGICYGFLFMQTKKLQRSSKKIIIDVVTSCARILFLGLFLHFLLKSWQTHSILIVASFITSFILTVVVRHKP